MANPQGIRAEFESTLQWAARPVQFDYRVRTGVPPMRKTVPSLAPTNCGRVRPRNLHPNEDSVEFALELPISLSARLLKGSIR